MEEDKDIDMNKFNLNKEQRIKLIVFVAVIITIGFLIFFLWREDQIKKEIDVHYTQMEEEMESLTKEKQQLENDLSNLEKNYNNETQGISSVVFLFTDLNENIYTDIYPLMKEYGFVGTLTLSPTTFPGQDNCLSLEQFSELIKMGWQCCLKWDESEDIDKWLESCKAVAKKAGIGLPEVVYFPENSYRSEYNGNLMKQGISIIVHHGEEELTLTTLESKDNFWYLGAIPWNRDGASSMLSNVINQKGDILFTIGSDSSKESYKRNRFNSMLTKINNFSKANNIFVSSLLDVREYRKELENKRASLENNFISQKEDLETKISELDKKIDSIYDKYLK